MTEQIMALLKASNGKLEQSEIYSLIDKIIADSFEKELSRIIHCEFNDFMGFKKNEQGAAKAVGNSRNGSYSRDLQTQYGKMKLEIPRDRLAKFKTRMFDKHKRRIDNLDESIKILYAAGLSDSEIESIIDNLYDNKLSQSTVSNIAKTYSEEVKIFKQRELKEEYFAIFVDATYLSLKRDTVDCESINTVMGIDMHGQPEILAYSISPNESKTTWEEIFNELKTRGVKSAKILISDGFVGIEELMHKYLGPKCLYQRCAIHLMRNLRSFVRVDDQDAIVADFKKTLFKETKEEAYDAFNKFVEYWGNKYQKIRQWAERAPIETIYNYYNFPQELRKFIYTNNRIESLHSEMKRKARNHIQFPTEDSLERFVVMIFNWYNHTKGQRHINNWKLIANL